MVGFFVFRGATPGKKPLAGVFRRGAAILVYPSL
jgi:hypothetical protein